MHEYITYLETQHKASKVLLVILEISIVVAYIITHCVYYKHFYQTLYHRCYFYMFIFVVYATTYKVCMYMYICGVVVEFSVLCRYVTYMYINDKSYKCFAMFFRRATALCYMKSKILSRTNRYLFGTVLFF